MSLFIQTKAVILKLRTKAPLASSTIRFFFIFSSTASPIITLTSPFYFRLPMLYRSVFNLDHSEAAKKSSAPRCALIGKRQLAGIVTGYGTF